MYAVVTVIVNGALESEETFIDTTLMYHALDEEQQAAEGSGEPTEVYVMYHDHDPDVECECAQYEQSGKPKYIYNRPGEAGEWQS